MISNPYYSEARGVPQSYGTFTGVPMSGTSMPIMAPGMNIPPGMPGGGFQPTMTPGTMMPPPATGSGITGPALEESFIENILRLNLGKVATLYMTYENNSEWNAKIFKGVLEAAGRDHIIISDPQTGMRFLLLMVNLDYATFDEELNYSYPTRNHSISFG